MKLIIAATMSLLMVAVSSAAQDKPKAVADVTGVWLASFETGIGRMEYTYDLAIKNGRLTGTATSSFGTSTLAEGKVDGDTVSFVETLDGSLRIVYRGRIVSADEIQFVREVVDVANEELVARRVKQ